MRLTMLMVLSSSLVFAQTDAQVQQAAQMQVQQDKATHNAQAAQQQAEFQQMLNPDVKIPFTPAPKLSPKPGTFHGRIPPVSITDTMKDAEIYFTTDGSKPTRWSKRYTRPISLSATTKLKAMAIAPSCNESSTVGGKYVVK